MLLSKVHGVGAAKAHELVEKYEITSIEQLRERKDELLNHHQLIGIKYGLKKNYSYNEIRICSKIVQIIFLHCVAVPV